MPVFKMKIRKSLFWKTYKVNGFHRDGDRMVLSFLDGSILEIAEWSKYDCKLGTDYFDVVKKEMEKKSGQAIITNEVR